MDTQQIAESTQIDGKQRVAYSDEQLQGLPVEDLVAEILRLRDAIRLHRGEKGNDRCWLDDQRLYGVLPDVESADFRLPCRGEFLKNCERYWSQRQDELSQLSTK